MLPAILILFTFGTPGASAQRPTDYAAELRAFFEEIDRSYPFLDVKGIRKEWSELRTLLVKEAARVKSDGEFMGLVLRATRGLRDGHAAIDSEIAPLPAPEPERYPGLSLVPATRGRVAVLVPPPGLESVLPPGTVITKIDGEPARAALEARARAAWKEGGFFSSPQRARFFEYRLPLRGPPGRNVAFAYLDGRNERKRTLPRGVEVRDWPRNPGLPPSLARVGRSGFHGRLEGGAGYVWLMRMDEDAGTTLAAALAAHPEAAGWIIDLQGNTGGGYDEALLETAKSIPKPVAVLIDAGCVSAGETFARDLVRLRDARLFGTTTAGSSSVKKTWSFPGVAASIRFSIRSRNGIDGQAIEFAGIAPHEEVEAEPEDLARGLSTVRLRAERHLAATRGQRR